MKPAAFFTHPTTPLEPLWNVADVSRFLGCSERNVYQLLQAGLPRLRVKGLLRFDPEEVRQWIRANNEASAKEPATIAISSDSGSCGQSGISNHQPNQQPS